MAFDVLSWEVLSYIRPKYMSPLYFLIWLGSETVLLIILDIKCFAGAASSKYSMKSFRFAAAVLWNSFPDNFRRVSSFNKFKALISYWSGKNFKYNLCR